jgi:5-methylcytosine-specific restriction protein A
MVCETYHVEKAPDRDSKQRDAIVFELRPLSAIVEKVDQVPDPAAPDTLEKLRALAKAAAAIVPLKDRGRSKHLSAQP